MERARIHIYNHAKKVGVVQFKTFIEVEDDFTVLMDGDKVVMELNAGMSAIKRLGSIVVTEYEEDGDNKRYFKVNVDLFRVDLGA